VLHHQNRVARHHGDDIFQPDRGHNALLGAEAARTNSCSILLSEISAWNCLGSSVRDNGHSLVPPPPDRMTGQIRSAFPLARHRHDPLTQRLQAVSLEQGDAERNGVLRIKPCSTSWPEWCAISRLVGGRRGKI